MLFWGVEGFRIWGLGFRVKRGFQTWGALGRPTCLQAHGKFRGVLGKSFLSWVAIKELRSSCHNGEYVSRNQ